MAGLTLKAKVRLGATLEVIFQQSIGNNLHHLKPLARPGVGADVRPLLERGRSEATWKPEKLRNPRRTHRCTLQNCSGSFDIFPAVRLSVRCGVCPFIAPSNEGALKWNIFKHLGWNMKII